MKTKEEIAWEFEKGAKIIKAALEMAMRRLDSTKDEEKEEETVTLRIEPEREKVITIPQDDLCHLRAGTIYMDEPDGRWAISTRQHSLLADKAFALNSKFNWQLGKDEFGVPCLVPLKKEKNGKT